MSAPCNKCGADAPEREILDTDGNVALRGHLCDRCHDDAWRGLYRLRRIFRGLVRSGIDEKIASARLCVRIARGNIA